MHMCVINSLLNIYSHIAHDNIVPIKWVAGTLGTDNYCKFDKKICENSIFKNSAKRHICNAKNL